MGAIVTVHRDGQQGEAERLLNVLADWAGPAVGGVSYTRSFDQVRVTFQDSDTTTAPEYIDAVLRPHNPDWQSLLRVDVEPLDA